MVQRRFSYFFLTILNGLLFLLEQEVGANPIDPTVTHGKASSNSTPQKLEVTAQDRTIISWKDFSIGSQETTRFNLPSSKAVVLNRVGSNMPSKIEGLLSSNGVVYLINPNGILISASGKIDTAGFLASTLNVADQDFLNGGDLLFTGSAGTLINQGTIRCESGDVVLMAYQIKNEQPITAPQGTINMATGQEVLLSLKGDEKLTVRLTAPSESKEEIGLHQTGTLEAMKAELKADGNLYAYAIKNEGSINAISSVEHAGRIYLVAEKGHVTNSGKLTAQGGEVRILGQTTSLTGQAEIDVSGEKGGGTVLVGGDYQGKNPDILNAEYTFVEPGVKIKADALSVGDGGKVIFWSDNANIFHGNISGQGGPNGGDGGFVEVSGKYLDYQGLTNTMAPQGKTGTLLLDPYTINIVTGGGNPFTGCVLTYSNPTTTMDPTSLAAALAVCSVIIDSTTGGTGSGVITFESPFSWTTASTNTLTVTSALDILVEADITNTSGGDIVFSANRDISFTAASFSQTGGDATFNTGTGQTGSFATDALSPIDFTGSGTLEITSINSGQIGVAGLLTLGGTSTFVAQSTGAGSVIFSGGIASTSSGPFTAQASGLGGVGNATFITHNVSFTGGSVVTIESTPNGGFVVLSSPTMTFSGAGGSLTATAQGDLQVGGNLNYSSTGLCQLTSVAGTNNAIIMTGNLDFAAPSGDVTISANIGNIASSGSITSSTPGTLTLSGNITGSTISLTGPLILTSPAGAFSATATSPNANISFSGGITSTTSTSFMALAHQGTITTVGATAVSFTGGSPVTLSTAGASGGAITLGSPMTFSGAAGSLTVDAQGALGINNTFSYSCNGTCSLTSVTSGIGNTSATTFSGIGDITITATAGQIETHGAIINSSLGTFMMTSGSSTFIEAPITFNSPAGPLTINCGGLLDLEALITNSSASSFTMNSTFDIQLIGSTAAIHFNPGAGPLMMTAGTSIEFFGPVTNSSSSAFTIDAGTEIDSSTLGIFTFGPNGGSLTINAAEIDMSGAMNFNPGGGTLTMTATDGLITNGTITYHTNATPMTLHTTNGTMTINAPIALNSTAVLNMTTGTGNISVQNLIRNISTGSINVTSGANLLVGTSTATVPSQIGTASGTVTISTADDVQVFGGSGSTSYAQIGFDTAPVDSNMFFTIGDNLRLAGGSGNISYAVIGHGSATLAGHILTGDITFNSIGESVFVQPSLDEVALPSLSIAAGFAQIGHLRAPAGTTPVTAAGDISLLTVGGSISVVGESGINSYALIGHGGGSSDQPDNYSGDIQVSAGTTLTVATRAPSNSSSFNVNSYAAIGHSALMSAAGTITINSSILDVTAADSILVQSQPGNIAIIGSYVNTQGMGGIGSITLTPFNVTATTGNLVLSTIAPATGSNFSGSVVGPLTCTGAFPLAAAGSASSPLIVTVGGDLELQTGYAEGTGTSTFTLIQNGMGAGTGSTTVNVTGKTSLFGGNNVASITGTGAVSLTGTGSLTLAASPQTGSLGSAQIIGNDTTVVSASAISLSGFIGGPSASIQNTTGDLTITSGDLISLTNNASINLTGGSGTLTISPTSDLALTNSASINSQSTGPANLNVGGMTSLLAGVSNASITTTGPLTLTITGNNLNLVSNSGGSATITAGGALNITANNMNLSGLGTGQQSSIQGSAGDMLLIAQNNIALADNALIQNTGTGALTLVVDDQAPASISTGRFLLAPNAMVNTAGGALRVYTARPNTIPPSTPGSNLAFGQLNGNFVTAGLPCAFGSPPISNQNVYDTFYPTTTGGTGIPYTIYYKQATP